MNEQEYLSAKSQFDHMLGEISRHAYGEYELHRQAADLYRRITEYEIRRFGERRSVPVSPTPRPNEPDELLGLICKGRPTDFAPFGERNAETEPGPDCGSGCRHFTPLEGKVGIKWGVCASYVSPRGGLLTSTRQGCYFFEASGTERT